MSSTSEIYSYLSENVGENNKLVFLSDYDGTLAPITPRPETAIMEDETKSLLEKISKSEKIFSAIISGRHVDDVKNMIGIDSLTYAGSHGFEIAYPDGSKYTHAISKEVKEKLNTVAMALKEQLENDADWVENKGNCLTYHYQETPAEKVPALVEKAKRIIRSFGLEPSDVIFAVEVAPPIQWNKGYAAEYLLKTKYGEDWYKKVKVIFAGDDNSDEKLMKMLQGKAATFRISSSENIKTSAGLRLTSMKDVISVLKWVVKTYC